MNIILVSRTLTKLEAVAKEIEKTFNVETAVIDVDFTSGPEIIDKIKERVKGKEIGVLVNNVGMCYSAPENFLKIPDREKFIQNIIKCNITSMPMMCSIVLPQMVQRKKGVIINISSLSALVPSAQLCVYSASKAFAHKFSEDLSAEYENQGIIIQSVLPGPVATNMTKIETGSLIIPTPKDYVESALKTVGFSEFTAGYWTHTVLQFTAQFVNFLLPSAYLFIEFKVLQFVRNREIKSGRYAKVIN
jgi:17beta-estradiol 17-dehydrogenase / very-long-chain 3-oxoacyl-CoA reductase